MRWLPCLGLILLSACTCGGGGGTPDGGGGGAGGGAGGGGGGIAPTGRCDVDWQRFAPGGAGGATVKQVQQASELLVGPNAQGRIGDWRLENEVVRFIVQGDSRVVGPLPFGGTVLDVEVKDVDGGVDQFGELGLLYNFGRTVKPDTFEVLSDGLDGGAAVLAVSGDDERNDYLSIRNRLALSLGRVPVADPYVALPLRITTFYVLNPGEHRLRLVTGFCNVSLTQTATLAVGDLTDPGYTVEHFNPRSCTNGFGSGGLCFAVDRMPWYGYQGQQAAYAFAPWRVGTAVVPESQNATLTVAGITGSIVGADGLSGLLTWVDAQATNRPGSLTLPPRGNGMYVRDFWAGRDLGEVGSRIARSRSDVTGDALGDVGGVVRSGGPPVAEARVVFEGAAGRFVFVTGADGRFTGALRTGSYDVSAFRRGHQPSAKQQVQVAQAVPLDTTFDLTAPRVLTVNVREANGGPLPAKVTVLCRAGPCPVPQRTLVLYQDTPKDPQPDFVQEVAYVGASGTLTLPLPPAQYDVLVSRGPEYSVFPNTYPQVAGQLVDLRAANATVNAVLARVLDTTGWMSADFHVHAVNSPDSLVDNETRALTFAGDGVEVMVSTDHDVVTDFAPAIAAAQLQPFVTSVVGEEASPMEFGHYNFFPLTRDASDPVSGGALDWPGATGPTLTVADLFALGRQRGARTVHFAHPRGSLGGLTFLEADTDTLATHVDPVSLGMAVPAGATSADTKLLSSDFDTFEILNPGEDEYDGASNAARANFNDWFVLLSRGLTVAGTGVSDTHYRGLGTGWRTWVRLGVDTTAAFDPLVLSARLNALEAVVSNGPFVAVRAYRVDSGGAQVTAAVGVGGTVPPDTRDLGVTVEVQVPAYLDVTQVELFLHRPEDDATCPVDPMSPRATTTRVACDGVSNTRWPAPAASQAVTLLPGDLETAATEGATTFRRYRKQVQLRLPAPTTDNWLVAMVSGQASVAPLLYAYDGSTPVRPFAFSNPVFIDADGNGYDHPPFLSSPGGRAPPPARAPVGPLPMDEGAVLKRWGEVFGGH